MSLRTKILKSSMALTFGEGAAYGLSFIRNIILARLLTKADFGIASALAMMITMLEFTSKMAVDRVILQDQSGDDKTFIGTAHSLQFILAVFSVCCMILAAGPLSKIFGLASERWSFQVIALTPLFKGIENLDVRRMGRELRFVPSILVEIVPQFLITLATWPLSLWVQDYRLVLILLVLKPLSSCLMSHLLNENPYRWNFNVVYLKRIFKFGWPLLLNSFIMFGIFQGDRLLVGTFYTMSDLAAYSAASTLILGPVLLFMKVFGSIMLPVLSKSQNEPETFRDHYKVGMQFVSSFAALYALFLIIGGESLMKVIFGAKYSGAGLILAWLAAANALRFIRTTAVIAALSKADSKNPLISNMFRSLSLLFALLAASNKQPIWVIAAAGLIGEFAAFAATLIMLRIRDQIPWRWSTIPATFTIVAISAAGIIAVSGAHKWNVHLSTLTAATFGLSVAILIIICFTESRIQTRLALQSLHSCLKSYFLNFRSHSKI